MIRDIQDRDIRSLTDIYNWYIENSVISFETQPLSYDAFRLRAEEIRKHYPYLVLEENNLILGYAYLNHFNTRAAYDWTADLSIYIDHTLRGKGYGSKLMKAILDIAAQDGYVNVISIVTGGNKPSEHIHEKYGFQKLAVFLDAGFKKGKWLDITYYQKKLNDPSDHPCHPLNVSYEEK